MDYYKASELMDKYAERITCSWTDENEYEYQSQLLEDFDDWTRGGGGYDDLTDYFKEYMEPAEEISDDELFLVLTSYLRLLYMSSDPDYVYTVKLDDEVVFQGNLEEAAQKYPIGD